MNHSRPKDAFQLWLETCVLLPLIQVLGGQCSVGPTNKVFRRVDAISVDGPSTGAAP